MPDRAWFAAQSPRENFRYLVRLYRVDQPQVAVAKLHKLNNNSTGQLIVFKYIF